MNTKLTLTPSRHGNSAMVIAWYEDTSPQDKAKLNSGYYHEPFRVINAEATYAGVKVCNLQRIDDGNITKAAEGQPANTTTFNGNLKRVYEQFKENLSVTYSDKTSSLT